MSGRNSRRGSSFVVHRQRRREGRPKTPCSRPRGSSSRSAENPREPRGSKAPARTPARAATSSASDLKSHEESHRKSPASTMAKDNSPRFDQASSEFPGTPPTWSTQGRSKVPEIRTRADATMHRAAWSPQTTGALVSHSRKTWRLRPCIFEPGREANVNIGESSLFQAHCKIPTPSIGREPAEIRARLCSRRFYETVEKPHACHARALWGTYRWRDEGASQLRGCD